MDEEPNEHELEERLYAMIHHVDHTQTNVNKDIQNNILNILENAPRSVIPRYWHSGGNESNAYQKVNTPKDNASVLIIKNTKTKSPNTNNPNDSKPKEEKCSSPEPSNEDLLFQSPPNIVTKTIEILDHENSHSVVLESSDEDEVIEVELPPKPTITIESSDEDEVCIVTKPNLLSKAQNRLVTNVDIIAPVNGERDVSASPVPSVVSSASDDFIRSDCIALNISSRRPDNHSFDFSLHGSDLLGQATPSKKKKKKKTKDPVTSTPVVSTPEKLSNSVSETCFATPKSKAKNKKQKTKSYAVSEKSVPSADIYDSDSNQSINDINKSKKAYTVTEKSTPSADVYESDSSQPETNPDKTITVQDVTIVECSDSNTSDNSEEKSKNANQPNNTASTILDLTDSDNYITLDSTGITENIVMGNVSGFQESNDYDDEPILQSDAPKLGSTKVPQILFENLDFDNLKGNDKVCKRRRYSLTTLRAEMEKFYNESWGGEDFNHREIQKYMSRDKSLWVIDPKDRMPTLTKRKVTCNYCNRPGHRDDTCRMKPPVCYMCGSTGHYEPRCPSKICVNCGSPNHMYSTMCRNCSTWSRVTCGECGQPGHPASHCPDLWRRYHNTIDSNMPLSENRQTKKGHQMYCSGCTRRGHLVHTCRMSLPFSGLPINSPYVAFYRPVYLTTTEPVRGRHFQDNTVSSVTPMRDRNKRQSKSPTAHETHVNKKRNLSMSDAVDLNEKSKTDARQRKNSQGKSQNDDSKATKNQDAPKEVVAEKAPELTPISSANHDKKGHMIQDNEVSDTSDVITSAMIYVTNKIIEQLKAEEGGAWLQNTMKQHNVVVQISDGNPLLTIRGKLADQEAFQMALRAWSDENTCMEVPEVTGDGGDEEEEGSISDIPKKKREVLRVINKALKSLKHNLGNPDSMYKKLSNLQKRHNQLLKQKVISPKKLTNNRNNMGKVLKKLNMVLLGQAGLANGHVHLSKLFLLQKKVENFKYMRIPTHMRKEIGHHYHTIFTADPRDDYVDLLKTYNVNNSSQNTFRKETRKKKRARKKAMRLPENQSEPVDVTTEDPQFIPQEMNTDGVMANTLNQTSHSSSAHSINIAKLTFYRRRIMQTRPMLSDLKKTRMELVRKLHVQITSLHKNERISSKTLKKIKKVQEQAQMFLSNV